MKLFGRFQEYAIHDIQLYNVPESVLLNTIHSHPESEVIVKEIKPRKIRKETEGEKIVVFPNMQKRHRIVVVLNMEFLKISLYSFPMNRYDVARMQLEPIPKAAEKERLEETIAKMDPNNYQGYRHVETEKV